MKRWILIAIVVVLSVGALVGITIWLTSSRASASSGEAPLPPGATRIMVLPETTIVGDVE